MLALYNFRIHYIKGKENTIANILSRRLDYIKDIKLELIVILKERNNALIYATPEITTLAAIDIKLIER